MGWPTKDPVPRRRGPTRAGLGLGSLRAWVWTGVIFVAGASPRARAGVEAEAEARVRAVRVTLTVASGEARSRGARVEGRAEYELRAPARPGQTLRLLDFASFLREDPIELDETALDGYVDGPFDPGSTAVVGHRGARALERSPHRRDVVIELEPGARSVTLRYRVDVPARPWPFGCVRRQCSLSGALAPLPSVPARGGRDLPQGGRVVDNEVRWTVDRAATGVARAIVVGGEGEVTPYPSIFWGPRWRRTRVVKHGVEINVYHRRPRPTGQTPHETRIQLRRDLVGHVTTIGSELTALLTRMERPLPAGTRMTVVVGPLRSELAQAHPNTLIVSDRALELFPAGRLAKFHLEGLARGWAETLTTRTWQGRHDASTELWLAGAAAFALLERWREARAHRDEFAGDLLRRLAFIPAVDRFLYAQQASFSQTYFRGVEDQPPLRNHPLWFSHQLPTGRRLHEKLKDTLGSTRLDEFYAALFKDPSDEPKVLAERAYGYTLGWFFDQWLGPYPAVDYFVQSVRSHPVGVRYRHEVEVVKQSLTPVVEPVQLLVTERDGTAHFLVWNGQGIEPQPADGEPWTSQHTFVLETARPLDSVRIDPRQRLVQTPLDPKNVDPRFNDRAPAQFRFLYTGAGLSLAASEFASASTPVTRLNAVSGFAAFEASLRRDLRRTGHVWVARDRESIVAVGSGVNLWWGKKVNPQRRSGRVRVFTTAGWLSDGSLDASGGVRLTERLAVIHDTRRFSWWPERGRRLSLGVVARQTLRGTDNAADHRVDVAADAQWVQLWPIAHDHVIATSVRAEAIVPLLRDPEFRSLARVGGIGGLSGYAADEVFGLAQAIVQVEYRHALLRNLHINLAHLSYDRHLGGVAFAGAATSSACERYSGWFGRDSWYGHAGYGLTARLQILGVTPQLLRVEASVPLVRREGVRCLDQVLPDYLAERQGLEDSSRLLPPFSVNVLFNQPF